MGGRSRSRSPGDRRVGRSRSRSPGRRGRRRERSVSHERRRAARSRSPKKPRGGGGSRETLLSFGAYCEQHGARTPEEYDAYVRGYQKRADRAFFERHKSEAWLRERYHPASMEALDATAAAAARRRAAEWTERATRGELDDTSYDSIPQHLVEAVGRAMEAGPPVAEGSAPDGAVPAGSFVNDSSSLVISNVSSLVDTNDLRSRIESTPGGVQIVELWLSQPAPSRTFSRTCWLTLATPEMAQQVQIHLQSTQIEGMILSVAPIRSEPRAPMTVPPLASTAVRRDHDSQQATQLAAALDMAAGLAEPTVGLEGDLAIRYLREVHCFCYYGGHQYGCVAEMQSRCPDYYRVAAPEEGVPDFRGEAWAEALDYVLERVLAEAHPTFREKRLGRVDAERAQAVLKTRSCQPDGEGRFRCGECGKLFLTMDFCTKHFGNKHQDLLDRAQMEALDEQAFRNYATDPDHLISTEPIQHSYDSDDDRGTASSSWSRSSHHVSHHHHRSHRNSRFPPSSPPPIPEDSTPDPREIRSVYQEMAAIEMDQDEEEVDYRLM